jgi:hypothetical protein
VWLATAAAAVGVLALVDPRPVSRIRWALWAATLIVGVAVALGAAPLHAAWAERRTR